MKCFIKQCFNFYPSQDESISFFNFPVKSEKRDVWLKVLPPCNRPKSSFSKICSEHFAKSDILVHNKRKRLAPNAVPSIKIKDEKESICSGQTPFRKTMQIPKNILLPNVINDEDAKNRKHKSDLKERKSLKWALQTTGEDGVNWEYIIRNKLEILRRFIKSRNLDPNASQS